MLRSLLYEPNKRSRWQFEGGDVLTATLAQAIKQAGLLCSASDGGCEEALAL